MNSTIPAMRIISRDTNAAIKDAIRQECDRLDAAEWGITHYASLESLLRHGICATWGQRRLGREGLLCHLRHLRMEGQVEELGYQQGWRVLL